MKNLCYAFLILSVFHTGCSKNREYIPNVTFNDTAYIKIIVENDFDTLDIYTTYSTRFPLQPCLTKHFKIRNQGIYRTKYGITRPEMILIEIQDSSFLTYMLPDDTLIIKVGKDSSIKNVTSFYLKIDDPIFEFLQNEKTKFGCYYFQSPLAFESFNNKPNTQKDYIDAVEKINNSQNDRLRFLENNKQRLPKWFVDTYNYGIVYYSASMKYALNFNMHNWDLKGELPSTDVELFNPRAASSGFYWRFISDYFLLSHTVDNSLFGPSRMIALYNKASEKISSNLKGAMLEYYNAYLLYTLYFCCETRQELELVDEFGNTNNFGLNALEQEYVDKRRLVSLKYIENIEKETRLKPGDKSPYLYLKDTAGVFHTLTDYKGKIVYLHFWATWCGPCLDEMPSINQLASKLTNKPVVIVNVCLDDNYKKWKEIIDAERLEGINLICVGNWGNDLQAKYSFDKIPHYAIVDEKGLLVSNDSNHPNEVLGDLLSIIKE